MWGTLPRPACAHLLLPALLLSVPVSLLHCSCQESSADKYRVTFVDAGKGRATSVMSQVMAYTLVVALAELLQQRIAGDADGNAVA